MPFSGHESRCCSFCNKRARMLRMWAENEAERDGIRTFQAPPTQCHAGMQTLTAAARPTEPVAAACTAWDAAAAGDPRASEPAR